MKFHFAISLCGITLTLTVLFCHTFGVISLSNLILLQSGGVLSITYFSDVFIVLLPHSSVASTFIWYVPSSVSVKLIGLVYNLLVSSFITVLFLIIW